MAKEYRGAGRAGDCDVFKTLAKTNLARKSQVGNERRYKDLRGIYQNAKTNSRVPKEKISGEWPSKSRGRGRPELRKKQAFAWLAITSNE